MKKSPEFRALSLSWASPRPSTSGFLDVRQLRSSEVSGFGSFAASEFGSFGVRQFRSAEVSASGSSLLERRQLGSASLTVPLRRIVHRSALAALERLGLLRLSRGP